MALRDQINEDMKSALKAREQEKLGALRLLLAAMKQREIDERIDLTDADVLSIIDKMVKQRKDSITQFEAGGRMDLVAAEKAEVEVLSAYLPQQLSDAEIESLIAAAIAKTGAAGPAGMGKVMSELRPQVAGRADMGRLSALVKAKLTG
jgi:uncharacterized protein YqeY